MNEINTTLLKNLVSTISSTQMALKELYDITHAHAPKGTFTYNAWIAEEFKEFMAEKDDTPEQEKELNDLLWTCIQKANERGYNLAKGMQALVDEYTSKFYTADGKFEPIYREDGKLMKNTGFKKANFEEVFKQHLNNEKKEHMEEIMTHSPSTKYTC